MNEVAKNKAVNLVIEIVDLPINEELIEAEDRETLEHVFWDNIYNKFEHVDIVKLVDEYLEISDENYVESETIHSEKFTDWAYGVFWTEVNQRIKS